MFSRATVGRLVAVEGRLPSEQLIAIVERATRTVEPVAEIPPGDDVRENRIELRDSVQAIVVGTFRSKDGDRYNVFRRGADTFPRIDKAAYLIEGGNLASFMGLLASDVEEHERLVLGHFIADEDAPAVASGDRFFQRHAAVLGSTGSGKSWAVATILEQAARLRYPNIIVLDMHGEYAPLADSKDGFAKRFKIAGPGDLESPGEDALFLPYWALNRDELVSMLVDRSEITAANQTTRVTEHVRALKEECLRTNGRQALAELFTVDSPVPYSLSDLQSRIRADNTAMEPGATPGKEKQGKWYGQFSRLLARMEAKMADRRYGFMFCPPASAESYDWLPSLANALLGAEDNRGIKIIDFSETPSDVLPVVAGVLARLMYNIQFWMAPEKRTPVCLLCDEAHLYLPTRDDADAVQRQALAAFERIAKEGRKYGFSLVVVSQRPSDVSKTILSQCNNFLALRLTNETDQSVVRKLIPDALGGVTDMLPLLDTGEGIMLGDATVLPSRIRISPPTIQPASGTLRVWREWATKAPDENAIKTAVENMRAQSRLAVA